MEAANNLRTSQKQLDMDGTMVGVSRQALEEVLESHAELLAALNEAVRFLDYFANDGTIFAGLGTPKSALATVRAALAKASA